MQQPAEWAFLFRDLLLHIVSFLEVRSIASVLGVCSSWYGLCEEDWLWKSLCHQKYRVLNLHAVSDGSSKVHQPWRKLFISDNGWKNKLKITNLRVDELNASSAAQETRRSTRSQSSLSSILDFSFASNMLFVASSNRSGTVDVFNVKEALNDTPRKLSSCLVPSICSLTVFDDRLITGSVDGVIASRPLQVTSSNDVFSSTSATPITSLNSRLRNVGGEGRGDAECISSLEVSWRRLLVETRTSRGQHAVSLGIWDLNNGTVMREIMVSDLFAYRAANTFPSGSIAGTSFIDDQQFLIGAVEYPSLSGKLFLIDFRTPHPLAEGIWPFSCTSFNTGHERMQTIRFHDPYIFVSHFRSYIEYFDKRMMGKPVGRLQGSRKSLLFEVIDDVVVGIDDCNRIFKWNTPRAYSQGDSSGDCLLTLPEHMTTSDSASKSKLRFSGSGTFAFQTAHNNLCLLGI